MVEYQSNYCGCCFEFDEEIEGTRKKPVVSNSTVKPGPTIQVDTDLHQSVNEPIKPAHAEQGAQDTPQVVSVVADIIDDHGIDDHGIDDHDHGIDDHDNALSSAHVAIENGKEIQNEKVSDIPNGAHVPEVQREQVPRELPPAPTPLVVAWYSPEDLNVEAPLQEISAAVSSSSSEKPLLGKEILGDAANHREREIHYDLILKMNNSLFNIHTLAPVAPQNSLEPSMVHPLPPGEVEPPFHHAYANGNNSPPVFPKFQEILAKICESRVHSMFFVLVFCGGMNYGDIVCESTKNMMTNALNESKVPIGGCCFIADNIDFFLDLNQTFYPMIKVRRESKAVLLGIYHAQQDVCGIVPMAQFATHLNAASLLGIDMDGIPVDFPALIPYFADMCQSCQLVEHRDRLMAKTQEKLKDTTKSIADGIVNPMSSFSEEVDVDNSEIVKLELKIGFSAFRLFDDTHCPDEFKSKWTTHKENVCVSIVTTVSRSMTVRDMRICIQKNVQSLCPYQEKINPGVNFESLLPGKKDNCPLVDSVASLKDPIKITVTIRLKQKQVPYPKPSSQLLPVSENAPAVRPLPAKPNKYQVSGPLKPHKREENSQVNGQSDASSSVGSNGETHGAPIAPVDLPPRVMWPEGSIERDVLGDQEIPVLPQGAFEPAEFLLSYLLTPEKRKHRALRHLVAHLDDFSVPVDGFHLQRDQGFYERPPTDPPGMRWIFVCFPTPGESSTEFNRLSREYLIGRLDEYVNCRLPFSYYVETIKPIKVLNALCNTHHSEEEVEDDYPVMMLLLYWMHPKFGQIIKPQPLVIYSRENKKDVIEQALKEAGLPDDFHKIRQMVDQPLDLQVNYARYTTHVLEQSMRVLKNTIVETKKAPWANLHSTLCCRLQAHVVPVVFNDYRSCPWILFPWLIPSVQDVVADFYIDARGIRSLGELIKAIKQFLEGSFPLTCEIDIKTIDDRAFFMFEKDALVMLFDRDNPLSISVTITLSYRFSNYLPYSKDL